MTTMTLSRYDHFSHPYQRQNEGSSFLYDPVRFSQILHGPIDADSMTTHQDVGMAIQRIKSFCSNGYLGVIFKVAACLAKIRPSCTKNKRRTANEELSDCWRRLELMRE